MINLLLAEDHLILRDGLKALLKEYPEFNIVAEAGNGLEALKMMEKVQVDVLIADINMPEMDGIETIKLVKEKFPTVKPMILSMLENEKYVVSSFNAGALGYVLKTTGKEELAIAIRRVYRGEPYISHQISVKLLKSAQKAADVEQEDTKEPDIILTAREAEVLYLIAEGFTNVEIADKIFTSKRTVESHRKNLMEKTGTRNSAALIKFAILNGLLK